MDFFDLRPASSGKASPTIRTANATVLISFPAGLLEEAGLDAGAVKVQYGEHAASKGLRITADPAGAWKLTKRAHSRQLYVREIMPKAEVKETPLPFEVVAGGINLTLPSPWILAADHLVIRTKAPKAKPTRAKSA